MLIKDITKISKAADNVGLHIKDGKTEIYLPQGYSVNKSEEELKKDIYDVFLMIEKYKKNKTDNISFEQSISHDEKGNSFPFGSYLFLIRYYILNGIYKETEKIYKNEKQVNNTSWARTIKQVNPIFTKRGPIYTDFINRKNVNLNTNDFIEVYKYAINLSYSSIGKIFYNNLSMPSHKRLNKTYCIKVLKNELRTTNLDSKKTLINHMINIFNGNDNGDNQEKSFTIKRFEFTWEVMVEAVYGNYNLKDKKRLKAFYDLDGVGVFSAGSTRPDTIRYDKEEKKLYIIDAKYYQYGFSNKKDDLPATSDIRKQIAYQKSLKNIDDIIYDEVINIFMLPHKDEKSKKIGVARFNDKEVNVYLINIKMLINDYIKSKKRNL